MKTQTKKPLQVGTPNNGTAIKIISEDNNNAICILTDITLKFKL